MLNKPSIGRLEYFFYAYIVSALPSLLGGYFLEKNGGQYDARVILMLLISLGIVLMASSKRLVDLNLSPIWCILLFVPVVNIVLAIFLLFASGKPF